MKLKSNEITALLRSLPAETDCCSNSSAKDGSCCDTPLGQGAETATHSTQSTHSGLEHHGIGKPACDVAYVMFLEPTEDSDPKWSTMEWVADQLIRKFSPLPTMMHCELVVPPIPDSGGGKVHFATYLGADGAHWQSQGSDRKQGVDWYLIENGARWRALPVFAPAAADTIREACEANVHAPYSVSMYATSARPLRSMAWLWKDQPKHMGHCATITARILKQGGAGYATPYASAWYCPGSLYTSLNASLRDTLDTSELESLKTVDAATCGATIETMLRGPLSYATIRDLGDAKCIDAVRELTMRVVAARDHDAATERAAQKDLAGALLRWVLLREDNASPD